MNKLKSPPHIVMVNKAYPPWLGGIERHVADISVALSKRGWRVTALVCNDSRVETHEQLDAVKVIRVGQWGRIFSQPVVMNYLKRLRELQPDVVHVHVPFPLGWFVGRAVSDTTPIVCTWHSDIVRQWFLMPFLSAWQQRFLHRCDRIIPTSEPLMHSSSPLCRHHSKCQVIPLAIPPNPLRPQ